MAWNPFRRKPPQAPPEQKESAVVRLEMHGYTGNAVWTDRNFHQLAKEGYGKNAVVYRCVDDIAMAVSSVPLKAVRDTADGVEQVPSHPILDLMRRPNPHQSGKALVHALTSFLALDGNTYLEGVGPDTGPNRGRMQELYVKRPDRMKAVAGQAGITAYEYQVNGQTYRWEVDPITGRGPILHIKQFSPLNDFYGMGSLEAAAMAVDQNNSYAQWNFNTLRNGGYPPWVLVTDGDRQLTDPQFERVKKEIKDNIVGAKNAGKPALLEGVKPQPLGFSPREMEWIEGNRETARCIALAYGVPPMLLGIPGDNTYSNQQEARLAFWETTVLFYVSLLVGELNDWLDYGDDVRLEHDLGAVPALAQRRATMWERAMESKGLLTINERRELLNRKPVPGGDVILVSASEIPLEAAAEMPDQDSEPAPKGDKGDNE